MQRAKSLRPFTHVPGETCLLPGTTVQVTAYPTKIVLDDSPISLALTGPVEDFTLMQDLTRRFVRIFGRAKEGYFSYRLSADSQGITLLVERSPDAGIPFSFANEEKTLKRKETHVFPSLQDVKTSSEFLHFGCHKRPDWTLVKRRLSLEEILPIWFALGSNCPTTSLHNEGTAALLKPVASHLKNRDRAAMGPAWLALFRAGFGGLMTPRLIDTDHLGILKQAPPPEGSPFVLLNEGARLIRAMLVQVSREKLSLLPCLPIELHAGCFQNVSISETLSLDLEWSKKMLRTVTLRPTQDQTCRLDLPKALKSFRLRTNRNQRGERFLKENSLEVEKGKTYLIDRFEK